MKKLLLLLAVLMIGLASLAQDTLAVDSTKVKKVKKPKKAVANGFGLSMGLIYGMLRAETEAKFIPNSNKIVKSEPVNKTGVSAAIFYEYSWSKWTLRPAVEANLALAHIKYDVERFNDEEGYIFPLTIDLPVSLMYHPEKKNWPSFMIGARPIFNSDQFSSIHPKTANFAFNGDVGISYVIPAGKNKMRVELVYSYGFIDVLKKEENDTYSIGVNNIYRDILGLKLYFN